MKISFTSCCDPHNDTTQVAWPELAKHNPDVLVLLGDNMYMDYGFKPNPIKLGASMLLDPPDFAKHMYENYAAQWAVPSFHAAITKIPKTYAIWDDHDFARNNGRGEGTVCLCEKPTKCKCEYVPPIYREISRTLFEQFRKALITKPTAKAYPANLYLTGTPITLTGNPYEGIEQSIDLIPDKIRLHLLDGRSYRTDPNTGTSLLGFNQKTNLTTAMSDQSFLHLLISGTTLKDWKKYNDYDWLKNNFNNQKIIVLSGDIHRPKIKEHGNIFEFTASAMAQPASFTGIIGKESNVFGILDIISTTINVNIYQVSQKGDQIATQKTAKVDRAKWKLKVTNEGTHTYPDTD